MAEVAGDDECVFWVGNVRGKYLAKPFFDRRRRAADHYRNQGRIGGRGFRGVEEL